MEDAVEVALTITTLIGYLTASVFYVVGLYEVRWSRWATTGAVVGFISQTVWLGAMLWKTHVLPVVTLYDWVAFFVWISVGFYLVGGRRVFPTHVGGFLFPILFVVWLLSQFLSTRFPTLSRNLRGAWLDLHIILTTAGDVAFLLAAVFGIMYIEKERELKEKRVRLFYYQLPPLELMDVYGARLVWIGLPLLLVGLAAGAVWGKAVWGHYWTGSAKDWWSLSTLVVYLGYLTARAWTGWRGHRAAVYAMTAFLFVLFNIFGINLLVHSTHNYNF